MKTINQLTKDCLNTNFNEFYDEQKILFKAKGNFYDASKLDLKKIPEKISKFKGVLVMLDKENNIKKSSAHGKFTRDKETKKIKKYFSPFNPIKGRWTPFFISLEHNKIAFGYQQSVAISLAFGIKFVNNQEPTPRDKVYDLLNKKTPNEIDKLPIGDQKTMIASKCGRKVVEDLHPNWDKIFKEVHNLEDFKLHFFYIDEESPYTPSFFKQIIDTAARK